MRSFTGLLGSGLSGPGNVVPGLAPTGGIKAKKCHFPRSSWVLAFILTCNNKLAVWFKRGSHRHAGLGGVPGVCCLYPTSNEHLYNLAVSWWSAGHFVHRFLYRILPYSLVAPPKSPCGNDCAPAIVVLCCNNALPDTLHVTFTGGLSGSAVLTAPDPLHPIWQGSATLCGVTASLSLSCLFEFGVGYVFNLAVTGAAPNACVASANASSASCGPPLALSFSLTGSGGCCAGQSFTATVTT